MTRSSRFYRIKLDLPVRYFDGVFANAALFHVPCQELPRVLLELYGSLKPGGVLFSSNPHGHNEEGWNRPAGLPRERHPWLASVWRRAITTFERRDRRRKLKERLRQLDVVDLADLKHYALEQS